MTYIESPAISIPAGASPQLAFDHWVATEAGWDGGNVKMSVNGGAFNLVSSVRFDFNAYNSTLNTAGQGNDNPLAGEAAFTGTDGGSVGGTWGQSQVDLSGLAGPGDNVRLRFEMGMDGCNGIIGWYVDDVRVYTCAPDPCGDGFCAGAGAGEDCNTCAADCPSFTIGGATPATTSARPATARPVTTPRTATARSTASRRAATAVASTPTSRLRTTRTGATRDAIPAATPAPRCRWAVAAARAVATASARRPRTAPTARSTAAPPASAATPPAIPERISAPAQSTAERRLPARFPTRPARTGSTTTAAAARIAATRTAAAILPVRCANHLARASPAPRARSAARAWATAPAASRRTGSAARLPGSGAFEPPRSNLQPSGALRGPGFFSSVAAPFRSGRSSCAGLPLRRRAAGGVLRRPTPRRPVAAGARWSRPARPPWRGSGRSLRPLSGRPRRPTRCRRPGRPG